jgi:hypothetical protein
MVVTDVARKWMTHDERTGFPFRLGLNAAGIPVSEEPGETMAFVTIRIKGVEGYTRIALGKDRMVLGRSSDNDIPVKHPSLSREHCAFTREGDDWFAEDLDSSNGTRLNKDPAKLSSKVKLSDKDQVKCGQTRLTFHRGDMGSAHAAVDLSSDEDDDLDLDDGNAANAANAVTNAMTCKGCGTWISTAHRSPGEKMKCPRCDHSNAVAAH